MKSIETGKKLIQSAFTMAAVSILLIIVNLFFTKGGNFWAIYPIIFMMFALLIQSAVYFGQKTAEKFESNQMKKKKEEWEQLELKQLEARKRTNDGAWDENEIV